MIAFISAIGLRPILASEAIREQSGRICKLCELIQTCTFAISDLSYEQRQNVPIEVGLILGFGRRNIVLFGGNKYTVANGKKVKTILARASNLQHVDDIVYYDGRNLKSLAKKLVRRWCKSAELAQLLPKRMIEDTAAREALVEHVMRSKVGVDQAFKAQGEYDWVIEAMEHDEEWWKD